MPARRRGTEMRSFQALLIALAVGVGLGGAARALEEAPEPPHQQWPFEGVFGTYDSAASQRGFQVYKEVCSARHAVKHLAFRHLEEIGYTEDQVKGIAAQYQVTDGPNDEGQMFQRPARPSDPIPRPFPNDHTAPAAKKPSRAKYRGRTDPKGGAAMFQPPAPQSDLPPGPSQMDRAPAAANNGALPPDL